MKTSSIETVYDWALLPGGKNAMLRFPFSGSLSALEKPSVGIYRLAAQTEVMAMNYGAPYPWGFLPENSNPTRMWKSGRIGYGGLIHSAWFVLQNGERIGGAPNVPEMGPGAQRHYLLASGGLNDTSDVNENEGLAVVWEGLPKINEKIYRSIHAHVAKHITADRGGVIISPALMETDTVYVGFIGRCMTCPNPEHISINALRASCPDIKIELNPSWKDWEV